MCAHTVYVQNLMVTDTVRIAGKKYERMNGELWTSSWCVWWQTASGMVVSASFSRHTNAVACDLSCHWKTHPSTVQSELHATLFVVDNNMAHNHTQSHKEQKSGTCCLCFSIQNSGPCTYNSLRLTGPPFYVKVSIPQYFVFCSSVCGATCICQLAVPSLRTFTYKQMPWCHSARIAHSSAVFYPYMYIYVWREKKNNRINHTSYHSPLVDLIWNDCGNPGRTNTTNILFKNGFQHFQLYKKK